MLIIFIKLQILFYTSLYIFFYLVIWRYWKFKWPAWHSTR